ncbi:MAG: acyltransferase domain-containing protein, partial [Aggregatilineales bacterium]
TNFHVILEEYQPEQSDAYRIHNVNNSILLSAKSESDLKALVQNTLNDIQGDDATTKFEALIAASHESIPATDARVGFVAKDADEAAKKLQTILDMFGKKSGATDWSHPKGLYYRQSAVATDGNVVALFAGQGSQYTGMARELVLNFPEMRETFGALDAMFVNDNRPALSDVVFPIPAYDDDTRNAQNEALQQTEYAQPAIGALSAGMFNIFKKAGFAPDFAAGHSFGEVTALWAAGVMDDDTYYTLIRARGKAMAPPEGDFDAGTMAAVLGDVSQLESDLAGLPDVVIANHNSGKQVVIAGPTASIEKAQTLLADKGYRVSPLPVSAAFHTSLVGHAQSDFASVVDGVKFKKAKAKVFSNESGSAYPVTPKAIQNTLSRQILESVQFRQEIENIYDEGGRIFVEFGPRSILTNLTKEILGDKNDVVTIAMNASRRKDSDMQLRDAMVQLRVLGMTLGAFDAYDYEPPVTPPKKRGMKVTLTGGNYVSDATRKAYQDALNDGHTVVTEKVTEKVVQLAAPAPPKPAPVNQNGTSKIDDGLKTALSNIEAQRQQMQQVHEQFLQTQARYNELYAGALQQQQTLIQEKGAWLTPEMQQQLNANLAALQTQQQQIQQMHEQYMSEQSATLQTMLEKIESGAKPTVSSSNGHNAGFQPRPMMKPMAAPSAAPKPIAKPIPAPKPIVKPMTKPAPTPAPVVTNTPGIDVAELTGGMMEVVSEKTGYPVEMLEPEMDMEADLGIDSIKR